MATATKKPHVDDQRCGNCAWMRRSPVSEYSHECRWDGPPWHERRVTLVDWCRRWSPKPAPKTVVKEPDHVG